ncbi:MAG: hypothetical protein ACR2PI_16830 [Hyphomicrobiaceae bacterium]
MSATKSDRDGAEKPKQAGKARSAERQERLAQQLRENLKKRKEYARARKSTSPDSI